ncbi:MAG: hypothetical protein ABIL76_09115 [candidate division WOR-3 bacterium]
MGFLIIFFIFLYGIYRKNEEIKFISLWFLIILSIITIIVYFSGHKAEELLENQLNKEYIEIHEEFALWTFILSIVLLLSSIVSLITKKFRIFVFIILLLTIISSSITGFYGGQIKHDEIRKKEVKT